MVFSKYCKSEFLNHSILSIVFISFVLLLGNTIYSLYFILNLNKFNYTYVISCDLSIFKVLKLTEIWAVTSKLFLIILLTHFALKYKKKINIRSFVPNNKIMDLTSNFIVFFMFAILFHFIISFILFLQFYLYKSDPAEIGINIIDYYINNFFDYLLNVFLTYTIGYLLRKKILLMVLLLVLFSFNIKLPFLIGSSNLKKIHTICYDK